MILLNPRIYFSVIIVMNAFAGIASAIKGDWTRVFYQLCVIGLNTCIGWGRWQ